MAILKHKRKYYSEIFAILAIAERIARRERMAKTTYNIDLKMTDDELEQMYEELVDAEPTEENITATPTFRRIWDRVYEQIKTIEEEEEAAE